MLHLLPCGTWRLLSSCPLPLRGGTCIHKAFSVQRQVLVEHWGNGLRGKLRDLIEFEAYTLDILAYSLQSPFSACRRKPIYFHVLCWHLFSALSTRSSGHLLSPCIFAFYKLERRWSLAIVLQSLPEMDNRRSARMTEDLKTSHMLAFTFLVPASPLGRDPYTFLMITSNQVIG